MNIEEFKKLKVGDKVRIVEEKIGSSWNEEGFMDKYLGTVMTIREIHPEFGYQFVSMEEDTDDFDGRGWAWYPEMIKEKIVEEQQENVEQQESEEKVMENEEKELRVCQGCGQVIEGEDYITTEEGDIFCEECLENANGAFYCERCGEYHTGEGTWIEDRQEYWCDDCVCEDAYQCDHCGEYHSRNDVYVDHHGFAVCEGCYDNHYVTCVRCGSIIDYDDCYEHNDEYYCEECHREIEEEEEVAIHDCYEHNDEYYCEEYHREIEEEEEEVAIHDYYYKPAPIFYNTPEEDNGKKLFMGIELEVADGGEEDENAQEILDIANEYDEHIYCKHDGSLDYGFEIVSHPMTLDYHKDTMPWEEMMKKLIRMGYRSHDTSCCGLHIHVNRTFFGDSHEEQENSIARVIQLVESFWNDVVRFTRRTHYNIERWANRSGEVYSNVKMTYEKAKDKNAGNRYCAINLLNGNTVEFRIFRGTLKYSTFIATLQFVDELCRLCKEHDDMWASDLSWSEFVSTINVEEKPELISYLKSRRLYVNEIVEETEESEEM